MKPHIFYFFQLFVLAFLNCESSSAQAQTPAITIQPQDSIALAGSTLELMVQATGAGPLTYEWYFNETNSLNTVITTLAGNGTEGYSGDGNIATNAELSHITDAAQDESGNLYIADYFNQRIRKLDLNGIITTQVGNGAAGYLGDGGDATNSELNGPDSVVMDHFGNMFIADQNNCCVRKIDTNGIISTVAGNGMVGFSGDGGMATNAELNYISFVALDGIGNLFIVDQGNNRIRKVDSKGIITTVAGNGAAGFSGDGGVATNAELNAPWGLSLDASGRIYISDLHNNRIRKVDNNGIITTVAGNGIAGFMGDGGLATNAALDAPLGLVLDNFGNIFIGDFNNHRVREVNTNGIIITVAGNGSGGYGGDGGLATNAQLSPYGVAIDNIGNLFIADYSNSRVRKITQPGGNTLTLEHIESGNAGNYSVVVSNPYGSITSSIVSVQVEAITNTQINILTQPNGFAQYGQNDTLSVSVASELPVSYQWYFIPSDGAGQAGGYAETIGNFVYGVALTNEGFGYGNAPDVSFVGGGRQRRTGFRLNSQWLGYEYYCNQCRIWVF